MKSMFAHILFLSLLLIACTQVEQPKSTTPTTDSLLTDIDIDAAILELAGSQELIEGTEGATIPDGEVIELNDDGYVGLSTQLVLDDTEGTVSYIKVDPNDANPWELWCIDQATDSRTLIYKGNREINSVAADPDCKIIVFSMFKRRDYEIYRLVVGGALSRLTSNDFDDVDVSQNAGAHIVVWKSVQNGTDAIFYRVYSNLTNFLETALVHERPQVQPSIDGNGENIIFIRELTNGRDRVILYNITTQIYTRIRTSSKSLEHPSFGNNKAAWLKRSGGKDKVVVKDLTTGTVTTVLRRSKIQHPHLAINGIWLTYGIEVNGSFDVFVKNLETGEKVQGVFAIAPREHFGMFWQLPISVKQTFDVYIDNNDSNLYHADSLNSLSSYTGTLKQVVEDAVDELEDLAVGGTIAFRAGVFDLGSDFFHIRDTNDLTFKGEGIDVTYIMNSSNASDDTEPFNFGRSDNITIRDLTVSAGGSPRSTSDTIDFDAGNNCLIENVKVDQSRGRGIVYDGKEQTADNNIIRNCVIEGVPNNGIEILASSNNIIEDCEITNVGGKGINITKSSSSSGNQPSNDNIIRDNNISNTDDEGIKVNGGNRNQIKNNTVEDSSDDGIQIGATNGVACDDNIVRNNTATSNTRHGLNISNSECNETVVGNNNDFTGNTLGEIKDLGTDTIFE